MIKPPGQAAAIRFHAKREHERVAGVRIAVCGERTGKGVREHFHHAHQDGDGFHQSSRVAAGRAREAAGRGTEESQQVGFDFDIQADLLPTLAHVPSPVTKGTETMVESCARHSLKSTCNESFNSKPSELGSRIFELFPSLET